MVKHGGFEETVGAHSHTHSHTHTHTFRETETGNLICLNVGRISLAVLAIRQANLNIPMGALRPGAGHPVKRREETVDTEEVRQHRRHTNTHTHTGKYLQMTTNL